MILWNRESARIALPKVVSWRTAAMMAAFVALSVFVVVAQTATAQQNPRESYRVGVGVSESTISGPDASYTREAMEAHVSGKVKLTASVGHDHCMHDIKVIEPLGFGLDQSAVEAVKRWRSSRSDLPLIVIEVNFQKDSKVKALTGPTCEELAQ